MRFQIDLDEIQTFIAHKNFALCTSLNFYHLLKLNAFKDVHKKTVKIRLLQCKPPELFIWYQNSDSDESDLIEQVLP